METIETCTFDRLEEGFPGLSGSRGKQLAEASIVCFEHCNHNKKAEIKVSGYKDCNILFQWQIEVTDQMRNTYNDFQELTEEAACGVAILLVLKLTGYEVVQRSKKGTGVDYWLSHKDSGLPFQRAARLEVSGILKGTEKELNQRLNIKKKQTTPSDGYLPVFITIVEFTQPASLLVKK